MVVVVLFMVGIDMDVDVVIMRLGRLLIVVLRSRLFVVVLGSGLFIVLILIAVWVSAIRVLLDFGHMIEVMSIGVLVSIVEDISLLSLAEIVIRGGFVVTEHLDGGGSLDAVFLGQIAVGHHINSAEFDMLAFETSIIFGSLKLWIE